MNTGISMTFFLHTLRDFLWCEFNISPDRVWLSSHLRADLHLTDDNVKAIIRHLTHREGIAFSVAKVQQLTDVFDLMAYMLLRSLEDTGPISQADDWPFADVLP